MLTYPRIVFVTDGVHFHVVRQVRKQVQRRILILIRLN
jgi:hypothetical protein